MHRTAHKTALVINDASKGNQCLHNVDSLLKAVHNLFNQSHERQQEWSNCARGRGIKRFASPLFVPTQWLSRIEYLDVLCTNLPVLLSFLSQYNERSASNNPLFWPVAVGVKKRLLGLKAVSTLFLTLDMLQPIAILCQQFQSDGILPHEVEMHVKRVVQQLDDMFVVRGDLKGEGLSRFKRFCAQITKDGLWVPGPNMQYKMRKCSLPLLHADMRKLVGFIISRFKERFESSELLWHFHIFIPIYYLGMPIVNIEKYGWESFKVLLAHFCGKERGAKKLFEFDGPSIINEFLMMKKVMHEVVNQSSIVNPVHVWLLLRRHPNSVMFPKMIILVNIMFLIPVQTAIVERGFSVHRIIKNRLTNRLQIITLDSLLRIKMMTMGQDLKSMLDTFDFDAAVAAHTYVPFTAREDLKLRTLFKKVGDIELGLLGDGLDEGEEPDFSIEDEVEDDEDVGACMSEGEEEVDTDDGKDCFGVDLANEVDNDVEKHADSEDLAAAELNDL